jgi:hypothetical protein
MEGIDAQNEIAFLKWFSLIYQAPISYRFTYILQILGLLLPHGDADTAV